MTEFEVMLEIILLFVYGLAMYLAGKGDFANLVVLMLQNITKELKEKLKEGESDENP